MSFTIISPHLDDAVLSLGQLLDGITMSTVVTIFAGVPGEDVLTDYDRSRGFTSSADAMRHRRVEDRRACKLLGANVVHLDFLDLQYEAKHDDAAIVDRLCEWTRDPDDHLFVPLGIGHPDHVTAARCARNARKPHALYVYEELPYRVLHPEQVVDAFMKLKARYAVGDVPHPWEIGARDGKELAIACYESQFPKGADDPCLLVPERTWQIAPVQR